jgi:hypothetical protein
MNALREMFGDRIISSGFWLECSPDFKTCDFYLWGTCEAKSLQIRPSHSRRTEGTYSKGSFLYFPIRTSLNICTFFHVDARNACEKMESISSICCKL